MPRTMKAKQVIEAVEQAQEAGDILVGTRFQNSPNMDGFIKVIAVKTDTVELKVTDRKTGMKNETQYMTIKTVKKFMDMYGYTVDAPIVVIDPIETDEDDDADDDDGEVDPESMTDRELLAMKHGITVDELDEVIKAQDDADVSGYGTQLLFDPEYDIDPETSDDDDGDDGDDGSDDDTEPTTSSMSDVDVDVQNNSKPDTGEQRIGGTVDDDIAGILFTTMASLKITKNEALSMAISLLATSDKDALKKALANVYQSRLDNAFKD